MQIRLAWPRACAVCFIAWAVCQIALVAVAQTAPSALERQQIVFRAQKRSFAEVVAALSLEMKRGIVADGVPRLPQADFDLEGTAREVLDRVTDVFDYQWTLSKSGVILLSKRFQNPNELPQLNLPELQQMAQDAHIVLRQASGGQSTEQATRLVNDLFNTFSPEQRQQLEERKPLPLKQLTDAQTRLLQAGVLGITLDSPRQLWNQLASQLASLRRSTVQWKATGQMRDALTGQQTDLVSLLYHWQDRNGQECTVPVEGGNGLFALPTLPEE